MISDIDAVLRGAGRSVGAREEGNNSGPFVERVLKVTGNRPPDAWCCAWVADVGFGMLGDRWPLKRTAGCQALFDHATGLGLVRESPVRGDVFVVWFATLGRYAHTGFVLGFDESKGLWRTLEGNTNPGGSRAGYGVFERHRPWGPKDRFIRWTDALKD